MILSKVTFYFAYITTHTQVTDLLILFHTPTHHYPLPWYESYYILLV